jgi:hypothetical protein
MLPFLAPLALIPGPYKLLAIALVLATSHGYAFLKGKGYCEGQAARVEIREVEKLVVKTVEIVKKDTAAALKAAKQRDAEKKRADGLEKEVERLLKEKPLPSVCVSDPEIGAKFNELLAGEKK